MFAPPIAVAGQTLGIALACEDGVENLHPRLPINIADDLRQFEVHPWDHKAETLPLGFPPVSRRSLLGTLWGSVGHGVAIFQDPLQHILIIRFLFQTGPGGRKAD